MIKSGYFRIKGNDEQIMSYRDFYERGPVFAQNLKAMVEQGKIMLFCACKEEDCLELSITKNGIIRMKENNLHELHASFCPRSEEYNRYLSLVEKGVQSTEDGKLMFKISIPSGYKKESSGGSGESSGEPNPERQRTSLSDMVFAINSYAWEKQTFSVKKALKEARQKRITAEWCYKNLKDFTRLFFGVANDIQLLVKGEFCTLADICYRPATFKTADYKEKFFFYAQVSKVAEFKEERKYQYVTTNAISFEKKRSVTVRIPTEDFQKMCESVDFSCETPVFITGYVRHDCFEQDGNTSEWMTLVKGIFIYVSQCGLFSKNTYEAALLDYLCDRKLLFVRPYHVLHNFGDEMPFLMIERFHDKNILLDVVSSNMKYEEHMSYAKDNPEYDILVIKKNTPPEEVYDMIENIYNQT